MTRSKALIILALALLTLCTVAGQGRAESQNPAQGQAATGNFRDPENVPKLRATTNAQREEAARKAAEYREEAARAAAHKRMTSSGAKAPSDLSVPPEVKGGANE